MRLSSDTSPSTEKYPQLPGPAGDSSVDLLSAHRPLPPS